VPAVCKRERGTVHEKQGNRFGKQPDTRGHQFRAEARAMRSAECLRSRRDDNGLLVPLLKVVDLTDLLLAEFLIGVELLDELLVALEVFTEALILILHGPDLVALLKSSGNPGRAAQVRGYAEGDKAEHRQQREITDDSSHDALRIFLLVYNPIRVVRPCEV